MLTNCEKLIKPPVNLPQEYCKCCGKPLLYVEVTMGSIKQHIFRPCFCQEHTQAPSLPPKYAPKRSRLSAREWQEEWAFIGIPMCYTDYKVDYSAYLQALKTHHSLLLHSTDDDTSHAIAAKLTMFTYYNTISSRFIPAVRLLRNDKNTIDAQKVPMLTIFKLGDELDDEPANDATLARLYLLLKNRIDNKRLTVITSRFDKAHLLKHYAFNAEIVKALTTLINDEFMYYDVKDTDEKAKR